MRGQSEALAAVRRHLKPTFAFVEGAEILTDFGHYASVIKLSDELALAICTDGVGSKTIVASRLDRYDTIAYDCVAMNVNDLICVGARPLALVDYLGVHSLDAKRTDDLLRGLSSAAKEAGIAIPGGEVAQLPEIIGSGPNGEAAFDLVGTCVGKLHPQNLILGQSVRPGHVMVGLASSGLHSNGYTLARRVLLEEAGLRLGERIDELGCTLGEELLRPTAIYVRAMTGLWDERIETHGVVHITGDGFANLARLEAETGYMLDSLPPTPPIFDLIAGAGGIDEAEMFRVFNMGVGLVVIVSEDDEFATIGRLGESGYAAGRIGTVTDEGGVVRIPERGLVGGLANGDGVFERQNQAT